MSLSYNKLWKKLNENNMNKVVLRKKLGLSSSTIAKMTKGETVTLTVIEKICRELNCDLGDVVEIDYTSNTINKS